MSLLDKIASFTLGASLISVASQKSNAEGMIGFGTTDRWNVDIVPPKDVRDVKGYTIYWGLGDDANKGIYPYSLSITNSTHTEITNLPLATTIAFTCRWFGEDRIEQSQSAPVKVYSFERISMGQGKLNGQGFTNEPIWYFNLRSPKNAPSFEGFEYSHTTNYQGIWMKAPEVFIATEGRVTNTSTLELTYVVPKKDVFPDPATGSIYFRHALNNNQNRPEGANHLRLAF